MSLRVSCLCRFLHNSENKLSGCGKGHEGRTEQNTHPATCQLVIYGSHMSPVGVSVPLYKMGSLTLLTSMSYWKHLA